MTHLTSHFKAGAFSGTRRAVFSRRRFLAAAGLAAAAAGGRGIAQNVSEGAGRGMKLCLTPGSIGVSAGQEETIALAVRHGFEAVEPFPGHLAALGDAELAELLGRLKQEGLVWGAAGLPVDFRGEEARFEEGLKALPRAAKALSRAGADRVGTWLSPAHSELSYLRNFRRHASRLRAVARLLAEHGQRLGLEYVGTRTAWTRRRYPFVHTMAEALDLIGEIGESNVGLVLDSWHWWQADDGVDDIVALNAKQVVSVDLNDAPLGVAKDQQQDGQRELPSATGVINLSGFLNALRRIGYDGPVRPEPFNRALNALGDEAACAATIQAMRTAMARGE